jgi:hypothetical protein
MHGQSTSWRFGHEQVALSYRALARIAHPHRPLMPPTQPSRSVLPVADSNTKTEGIFGQNCGLQKGSTRQWQTLMILITRPRARNSTTTVINSDKQSEKEHWVQFICGGLNMQNRITFF